MTDSQGRLIAKDQVCDYMYRGEFLSDYSVYQFFQDTWEKKESRPDIQESDPNSRSRRGQPCHSRIPYTSAHPAYGSHVRVLRGSNHNNIPNFIGPAFPRNDDPSQRAFYCASMLMLFKPWHNMRTDLKADTELRVRL